MSLFLRMTKGLFGIKPEWLEILDIQMEEEMDEVNWSKILAIM